MPEVKPKILPEYDQWHAPRVQTRLSLERETTVANSEMHIVHSASHAIHSPPPFIGVRMRKGPPLLFEPALTYSQNSEQTRTQEK
jgi:hypothetical protein